MCRRSSRGRVSQVIRALCSAIYSIAALSACGGGDPGIPADIPTSRPASQLPRIQLFGDSTLHLQWPLWVERWGSRIENRARDGTGSAKLIAGRDGLNQPWPRSVTAPYYVVNHGMNDGFLYSNRNRMLTLEEYRANLKVLAHASGAKAIFMTPNPSTREGRDMAPYAQVMREVAREEGLRLIDVFECFQWQPEWRARLPDGTHPDEQGLRYVVDVCVAPVVEGLPP